MKTNRTLSCLFLFCCSLLLSFSLFAAEKTQFSKVVFFGDSLSDMGNNQDGLSDQSPVTNKVIDPQSAGGYKTGDVWSVSFVRYLKQDGFLTSSATIEVKPSIDFDKQIEIKPTDSIDFAYSGDPSDGYAFESGRYVVQYHQYQHENDKCVDSLPPDPASANNLCGAKNRARDFAATQDVDPNALYVIWIGANDVLQDLGERLQNDIQNAMETGVPIAQSELDAMQTQAAQTILHTTASIGYTIYELHAKGAQYFMVPNLPNIGLTPSGYDANFLYSMWFPQQKDMVLKLFTDLTNGFNGMLKKQLDSIPLEHPVAQPDVTQLFDMARDGKLAAFPASTSAVNVTPVKQWLDTCCTNATEMTNPQAYDPAQCKPDDQELCSNQHIPTLPQGGHYLFYNGIHPTTCTAKYIAKYFESYLPGGEGVFDPSQNLCSENE